MKAKTPTLKDIATELGVSISTVSRALRGMPEINLETREAVLKLSKNLEYKLPSSNHPVVSTQSNVLAAIIPKFDFHFTEVVKGMDEAAIAAGFTLMICQTSESYGREVTTLQRLMQTKIDGFIITKSFETSSFEHYHRIIKNNIPTVFIDRECMDVTSPTVLIENNEGGKLATKHLIEKGYRKICFLGAKSYSYSKFTLENGILDALKEARIDGYDKKLIFGEFDSTQAFEKTSEILKMNERPDAFFAANDQIAAGIFRAVTEAGYNIPKDIGIIGYFDEPSMASFSPSISCISVPSYEMGKQAINSLIEQIHLGINGKTAHKLLKPTLVARESSNQTRRFFGI